MDFLGKVYTLERNDDQFESFLKLTGNSEEKIAAILSSKPTQKLIKNGDGTFTAITVDPRGPKETTFTLGKEIEDVVGMDTPVKSVYTLDGNTLTQVITADAGSATFKKEFKGDELVVTITSDKWDGVAHRYYKA